ncbi:hypothetical protein [Amycolatopsis sp. WGS_07]|uniref:hypothetical protein n=1 Tax=Amycolatopsis sp. WGS_07 TaxID=3076764 RepID=UPI003873635A
MAAGRLIAAAALAAAGLAGGWAARNLKTYDWARRAGFTRTRRGGQRLEAPLRRWCKPALLLIRG